MNIQGSFLRSAPAAALIAASTASGLAAQSLIIGQPRVAQQQYGNGTELFEWTGRVDREIQVVMRGNQVWTNNVGQTESPRARAKAYARLPREDGQVAIQLQSGRGQVDVIQQPSRQNNYTTIVRITDPRSGSDSYRLAAYWQGYANGDVYGSNNNRGNNGRGRGNGNGRDVYRPRDRDDRDDDRDDNRRNNGQYGRRDQEVLHWSGNVDGELEIRMQNGRVDYRTLSGDQPSNVRANPGNTNVRLDGTLSVVQNQGRGSVSVVQQPSQWNAYTTILRIRDPQSGSAYYDFTVIRQ